MNVALLMARLVLGCVLLISAGGKLRSFDSLVKGIGEYQLFTPVQARLVARTLPYLELGLAGLLVAGELLPLAAAASLLLLLAFTAAIVVNLGRGRKFPCHCFGANDDIIGAPIVARNAVLMALAVSVAIGGLHGSGPQGLLAQEDSVIRAFSTVSDLVGLLGAAALSLTIIFLLSELDLSLLLQDKRNRPHRPDLAKFDQDE